jgi:uncharacterized membrane protein YkoI
MGQRLAGHQRQASEEQAMKVTISFDRARSVEGQQRVPEIIDIDLESGDDDGTAVYLVDSGDYTARVRHVQADGPIALVERAIFKLRRAGLK